MVKNSLLTQTPAINPDTIEASKPAERNNSIEFFNMITSSPEMLSIFNQIEKVAPTKSTVLILGESGTGKELIAKALHKLSNRRGKLVPVNCGAIPEDILESELFGHEKGSFTGAIATKSGRFQLAQGGTIFLDEIADMSPKLQVKLLRVIQEKVVDPVGATRSLEVDVRIIAATNGDLETLVSRGSFREDLFYRISVVPLCLPSLRERGNDVLVLADYFMDRACRQLGRNSLKFSVEFTNWLVNHSWPGNIRELENLIERLAILVESDEVKLTDLPAHILKNPRSFKSLLDVSLPNIYLPNGGTDLDELLTDLECCLIKKAIEKTDGDRKAAAQMLSIDLMRLNEGLKKLRAANELGFMDKISS
jgi:transcriptional regulator with GAF, ATPase, and Fis domain